MTTWAEVRPEHEENCTNYEGSGHGFYEGAGNRNPWTEEIGAGDAAYCISAACIVPYHHGVRWPDGSQFGDKGWAYCPYGLTDFRKLGIWRDDHASSGSPCDLQSGDLVLYSWGNNGVADHCETVAAVYLDDTFDTYGYNAGTPQGAHIIRRNRKYLMGRARLEGSFYKVSQPLHTPVPQEDAVKSHFGRIKGSTNFYYILPWYASGRLMTPAEYQFYVALNTLANGTLLVDEIVHEYEADIFKRIPGCEKAT